MTYSQEKNIPLTDFTDERTFEHLFRSHYAELVGFAYKYVNLQETAEELVQEVFMNVWSSASKIHVQTSLKSYLFGAVRNAALNHIKHEKVAQKYVDRQLHVASDHDATDFLELEELHEKITYALEKIPSKCREIFELNRFEGKRYKEIAEELNISLKTVENQMGKALKILRKELKEYLPLVIFFMELHGGNF